MDSSLHVESTYGVGSVFTATLPQKIDGDELIGDFSARMSDAGNEPAYRASFFAPDARLLVADDNEMNLEVITALLTDTKININTADSGPKCIKCLEEASYDVILLDQMMPGMSGTETLSKIRKRGLAEGIPIIALTADAIVGARDSYIRKGFTDYLSKPVMYEELENILLKYINKDLILTEEQILMEEEKAEKPIVLVISDSSEKLNEMKETLGDRYKGVFVRDEEKARKYLSSHSVEFIVRDGGQER